MFFLRTFLLVLPLFSLTLPLHKAHAASTLVEDANKAVILAYHRIGEDTMPDASLTIEQFNEHIDEIERGGYHVAALPEILQALAAGTKLPPQTIAITFEGAYRSALENAIPLLLEKKLPFTIFYSSTWAESSTPEFMSLDDLKKLNRHSNVTLATLPAPYDHMAGLPRADILRILNKTRQNHREIFGKEADYFSYPYGEYSLAFKILVEEQGYKAAFGLQSGSIYEGTDLFALPRFSMTEEYGDIERFRLVANALPLPVSGLEPADPLLGAEEEWHGGFTLPETLLSQVSELSCFISGQTPPDVLKLGARVEIRPDETQNAQSRVRINCTMPGPESTNDNPQWRWLGLLYHRPEIAPSLPPDGHPPLLE